MKSCNCSKRRFSVCSLVQILIVFTLAWLMLSGCNRNPGETDAVRKCQPLRRLR